MKEHPKDYTKDGLKMRGGCLGVFSLQTGMYIMVYVDIGLLTLMTVMLYFNKEANEALMA